MPEYSIRYSGFFSLVETAEIFRNYLGIIDTLMGTQPGTDIAPYRY